MTEFDAAAANKSDNKQKLWTTIHFSGHEVERAHSTRYFQIICSGNARLGSECRQSVIQNYQFFKNIAIQPCEVPYGSTRPFHLKELAE